jgi:succinate dehydrogenase / fumarate reductase, flavoprotein subunit
VISKLHPTRSHTGTAQGGSALPLANLEEDSPEWHAFDTVKGSDYLGDQDAIEFMCNEAIEAVIRARAHGAALLPHTRRAHRPAPLRWAHQQHHQGPVRRSCYSADRTGHMILQTLYQQCIKNGSSSTTNSRWWIC